MANFHHYSIYRIGELEDTVPQTVAQHRMATSSQEPPRRASTGGHMIGASNSYQHGTVRLSMADRRRSADVVAMPNFSGKGGRRWHSIFWRGWGGTGEGQTEVGGSGCMELTDLTEDL